MELIYRKSLAGNLSYKKKYHKDVVKLLFIPVGKFPVKVKEISVTACFISFMNQREDNVQSRQSFQTSS